MKDKTKLLYSLLSLGEFEHRDFNEAKLAEAMHISISKAKEIIQANKEFLRITAMSETICSCGATLKVVTNLPFTLCKECGKKIDTKDIPTFSVGLRYEIINIYFLNEIKESLLANGWKINEEDGNFFTITKSKQHICCSFGLLKAGLKDYFTQRGWLNKSSIDAYIMVRPLFEAELVAYSNKDLKCVCIGINHILDDVTYTNFEKFVFNRILICSENNATEF